MIKEKRANLYNKLKREFSTLETLSSYPHPTAWCRSIRMGVSNWGGIDKIPVDILYMDVWLTVPTGGPHPEFTKLLFDVDPYTYRPINGCFEQGVGCLFALIAYIDTRG